MSDTGLFVRAWMKLGSHAAAGRPYSSSLAATISTIADAAAADVADSSSEAAGWSKNLGGYDAACSCS